VEFFTTELLRCTNTIAIGDGVMVAVICFNAFVFRVIKNKGNTKV